MEFAIIVILAVSTWIWFGPIGRQIRFGNQITKLTNIFERLEVSRITMPIGAGGGFDSLPTVEALKAAAQLEVSLEFLATQPRHEVTANLLKNLRLADSLGKTIRANAIGALLRFLIDRGVALDLEDFKKSYG